MKLYKVIVHEACLDGCDPTLPPMFYVAETDEEFVKDRISWAYRDGTFNEPLEDEPEAPEEMDCSEEEIWEDAMILLRKQAYHREIISTKKVEETYSLSWIDQEITYADLDVLQRLGILMTSE